MMLKKTLAVQQLLQKTTDLIAGLGGVNTNAAQQAIYTEVAAAFATTMPAGAALNSGTTLDAAVIGGLVKGAAERVKSAAGVSDAVKTALQGLNSDALGVVTAGGLKAQAEGLLKAADAELTAVMMHRWVVRGAHRFELPGAQPGRDHLGGRLIWDMQLKRWLAAFLESIFGRPAGRKPPGR